MPRYLTSGSYLQGIALILAPTADGRILLIVPGNDTSEVASPSNRPNNYEIHYAVDCNDIGLTVARYRRSRLAVGIISPVLGTRICFTVPRACSEPLEHVAAGMVLGLRGKLPKVAVGYAR